MCLYVTCFAYAHYYLLSIYCRMRKQSHILGKMISKAELPVDVPNPLDDDVSGDVNSLAYLAYFHSSSMMVNIYISPTSFMPITTCSFYLSVFCRMRGLSHTLGKTFGKAELCWHSSPPSWRHLRWRQLSGVSHSLSQLVSDGEHLFSDICHLFFPIPLLSSLCLSIAGCVDCLTLLARRSTKPSSLLMFITP